MKNKKAFTLAEVMIVLTVIGVLAAILVPMAFKSQPDKNVIKFQKAYNALNNALRYLVTTDKYYKNGDLGIKADGEMIDGLDADGNPTDTESCYFTHALREVINTKSFSCTRTATMAARTIFNFKDTSTTIANLDTYCADITDINTAPVAHIRAKDDVFYYYTTEMLGEVNASNDNKRYFGDPNEPANSNSTDDQEFLNSYMYFCIDIDQIGDGEAPFGFGVRVDGKIIPGPRAQEWLEKKIAG